MISRQRGQVLLLLIMIMGTVMVLAMTAIFQSTSETELSGTTQESQRALSGAEAALERVLLDPTLATEGASFAELGLESLSGIDLDNSQVQVETVRDDTVIVPRLDELNTHTMYLSDYDPDTPVAENPNWPWRIPYGGRFQILYTTQETQENQKCTDVALELIMIYDYQDPLDDDGQYEVKTFIVDGGNLIDPTDTDDLYLGVQETIVGDYTFDCASAYIDTELYPNVRLLLVKPHFAPTQLAFQTGQPEGAAPGDELPKFPPQGRTFRAIARSGQIGPTNTPVPGEEDDPRFGGIVRTVEIFQSYPQLMSELFTTTL